MAKAALRQQQWECKKEEIGQEQEFHSKLATYKIQTAMLALSTIPQI